MNSFSHLDDCGEINMVDVSAKPAASRKAVARAEIHLQGGAAVAVLSKYYFKKSLCSLLLIVAVSGCVSEKKANERAREAYARGQQQAMQADAQARQQRQQAESGPVVYVQGQVRHAQVPWEEGMKLSQVVWAAEYTGFMNPRLIRVLRNGQVAGELKGIDLLHHEDLDIEQGDTVLVVP